MVQAPDDNPHADDAFNGPLELLREAMEAMTDSVVILNRELEPEGPTVVYVNRAFEKLTGYAREEVKGKSTARLQGAKTDLRVIARLRRSIERGVPFIGQMYSYRKDGTEILLSWDVSPIRDEDGEIAYWVAVERDMTERNRLQRELLEVGARERRRLSHTLHDSLGQQLAGIAFLCKVLESDLQEKDPDSASAAHEISTLVGDAIEQTRALAKGLAPLHDKPESLASSLRELADGVSRLYRIPCRCDLDENAVVQDISVADDLFNIAGEAVNNAIKHAAPSQITVRLKRVGNRIELIIEDDGKGIDPDNGGSGMGLQIMAYRADSIGGGFEIVSPASGGTRVICSVSQDAEAFQTG